MVFIGIGRYLVNPDCVAVVELQPNGTAALTLVSGHCVMLSESETLMWLETARHRLVGPYVGAEAAELLAIARQEWERYGASLSVLLEDDGEEWDDEVAG